ncbi:uncharacterized protein F4822DRAFT_335455 [Hypoxylon trugodes]|uniref:uncharacterized protein n=1 Tax=Hypoxylon trugodes TaxID=326681 RepID=UPI00218E6377|nr:uncharacterized protein F4822DRAFT_335455 [Hypoxylon trugodes]KAI1385152.1 hypothetical protein F4822DRAFT_335455 [Hypoxylon trugodes]
MSSTLLPFLYHTRTILRANPRTTVVFTRSLHATNRRLKRKDDIPFEIEVGDENVPSEPTRRSTITPEERQIFERIFADIKGRGLQPTFQDDAISPTTARSTMVIMQQAAQNAGQTGTSTIASPGLLAGVARDRNKALLRFPPDLRPAASKAIDAIKNSAIKYSGNDDIAYDEASIAAGQEDQVDEGWKTSPHALDRMVELESKRHPERSRVEGLINSAKSDFELWDVLEQEVFTMPARLGLSSQNTKDATNDSISSIEPTSSKRKSRKGKRKDATVKTESEELLHEEKLSEDKQLNLYIHGPLYPAYLLLALRRLDNGFRMPSPLAFSILPRIKELGLESYVLGVSTPFYNELLMIYWTRRGDLLGLLEHLEEMRRCGLYFDAQTPAVLNRVEADIDSMVNTKPLSSFGRAIITMPQYLKPVRNRLRYWHTAVDISVRQREADMGF